MSDPRFTTTPENDDHIQKAELISNFINSQVGVPESATAKMHAWFDKHTAGLGHTETLNLMHEKGMITITSK